MLKLYYADISALYEEKYFCDRMSRVWDTRRAQLLKLRAKDEACRGLAASLLLRKALAEEQVSCEEGSFLYGAHGKPQLSHSDIHFNLSHAGSYAVCVVCDRPVGVDIEQVHRLDKKTKQMQHIADRILGDEERLLWEKNGATASQLLEIWTKKESFAKMTGAGLSMELREIDTIGGAFYQHMRPQEGYYVSVCTQEAEDAMQIYESTSCL